MQRKTTKQKKNKETTRSRKRMNGRHPTLQSASMPVLANIGRLNAYDRKQFTILIVVRTQSKLNTLIKHHSVKSPNQTPANKMNWSVVYTFLVTYFLHTHTCTHLGKLHTHTHRPFVTPPSPTLAHIPFQQFTLVIALVSNDLSHVCKVYMSSLFFGQYIKVNR